MNTTEKHTQCKSCNGSIRLMATKCPHCGVIEPVAQPFKLSKALPGINWIFVVNLSAMSLVLFGFYSCMNYKPDAEKQRVGREFSSMAECLEFIRSDTGEGLNVVNDKPGDVSGLTIPSKLFFRCEVMDTGTKGIFLQGRWDRKSVNEN